MVSVSPVGGSQEPSKSADVKIALLKQILDRHYKSVPSGTPVGCNLVIMQQGVDPIYLYAGNLPRNACQHWGSVSKQFTAACIAKLVAQGKVDWKDDIRKYFPSLPEFQFNGQTCRVTIDDLLRMRSGLPEMVTLAALAGKNDQTLSMEERIELLSKFPLLQFEPDSEQMYCNTNYYLLAEIVSRVANKPFADFVREEIFSPHEMQCRCSVDSSCQRTVDGYNQEYHLNTTQCRTWGATGVVGPPSDMVKWNAALESGELKDLLVPSPKADLRHSVYCRGLNMTRTGDYRTIYHGGAIDGFVTQFMRYEHDDPAKTFAFFLTTNMDDIPRVQEMSNEVVDVIAGCDARLQIEGPPEPPKAIAIPKSEAAAYEGFYESPLGLRYRVRAEEDKGSWVLHLYGSERELVAFVPTRGESGKIVFRGPIGDWIELTNTGFVLHGAKVAPFPFTRVAT